MPRGRRAVASTAERRCVLTVGLIAAAARVGVALVSFVLNESHLVGDELQSLELARTVAIGHTADSWQPGYGQQLYDSTLAFMAPLTTLTRLFGESRLVGQLWVAFLGTAVAVLTTRPPSRLSTVVSLWCRARRRPDAFAGLWSSTVLRESTVWVALVGVALMVAHVRPPKSFVVAAAIVGVGLALAALGRLRSQTLLVAALALPFAAAFGGRRWLLARMPASVLLALLAPAAAGLGIEPGSWRGGLRRLRVRRLRLQGAFQRGFVVVIVGPGAAATKSS